MNSDVLRATARKTVPWANGEGTTQTVAESSDRRWRVSVASASKASSFSAYPGFRRQIMPLSADGMRLQVNGTIVNLPRFCVHGFDGEDAVTVDQVEMPLLDLNVFTRRDAAEGLLSIRRVSSAFEISTSDDEIVVVLALSGALTYQDAALDDLDAVVLSGRERALFGGQGVLGVARITAANDAQSP